MTDPKLQTKKRSWPDRLLQKTILAASRTLFEVSEFLWKRGLIGSLTLEAYDRATKSLDPEDISAALLLIWVRGQMLIDEACIAKKKLAMMEHYLRILETQTSKEYLDNRNFDDTDVLKTSTDNLDEFYGVLHVERSEGES